MKESTVTRNIVAYLKQLQSGQPLWYLKLHGGPMQRAGAPDLIVLYHGRLLAIEIKRPGGKVTTLQKHTLSEMEKAGARAVVARCVEDVFLAMAEISPPA